MIDGYTGSAEKWSKRNDLHVRMIEQAGEDRVLFMNTKPHEHVNMKFPEYVGQPVLFSAATVESLIGDSARNILYVHTMLM
jgi:hypothetical protein